MKLLHGKNVLLTGASRGIGAVIARTLAEQGARVVGVARSAEGLNQIEQELRKAGLHFKPLPFDLQEVEQLKDLVDQVHSIIGNVEVLVNNAGVEYYQYYHLNSPECLQRILTVNLAAPMELTRLLLPEMLDKGGCIVNIASLAGKKGVAYNSIYSASKAGLIRWSDGLRQELAGTEVTVSVICPGYIADVGMFASAGVEPPAKLGTSSPQKVADAVVKAIEEHPPEIIVNKGPIKPLLALAELIPSLGDRVVKWFGVPDMSRKRIEPPAKSVT
jgi:short-subunit dehydrogenase